jgi:beta-galactosidase
LDKWFNIGIYWNIGSQKTLYVPDALLKKGINEVVLFEIHQPAKDLCVKFIDKHYWMSR